eukprot:m.44619 g.44619  ORF g.44619 m.44619 type:complete len:180 (-) comp19719_c0_seq1:196-735(-)
MSWQMCVLLLVLVRVSTSCFNPPYSELHGTHCVCVRGAVCVGSRCSHAKHTDPRTHQVGAVSGFKISACPDCTCHHTPNNVVPGTNQRTFRVNTALGVECETHDSQPVQNVNICFSAAVKLGLKFHSAGAYSHWGPGCFKHKNEVYFNIDLSAFHSKTQNNHPDHFSICAVTSSKVLLQ